MAYYTQTVYKKSSIYLVKASYNESRLRNFSFSFKSPRSVRGPMKINFYPQITQIFEKVKTTTNDKEGGAGQNAYERQQKKKEENSKEFEQLVNDENVQQAITEFAGDSVNQTNGISASMEGHGPGLKVILKDAGGGVLRAISGEEFLKLKEAVSQGKRSGRILDQKA